MARVKIDNISNRVLFLSCFFLAIGLIMIARMTGNIYNDIATNTDIIVGIIGAIIIMASMMYPLKRINSAVTYFPKQRFMIYFRFSGITLFIFGMVLFLNAWAWGSNHSKTTIYSGPAHYVENQFSRSRHADEIMNHSHTGLSLVEIIGLRALITTLSLGAFLLYFALLYQPYTTKGVKLDEMDIISRDEVTDTALKALSGYAGLLKFMGSKAMKVVIVLILVGYGYSKYMEYQEANQRMAKKNEQTRQLQEQIRMRFQQYQIQPAPTEDKIYVAARGLQGKKIGNDLHLQINEILLEKHESQEDVNYEGLGIWIYTSQPTPDNKFSKPADKAVAGLLTTQEPSQTITDKTFVFPGKGSICISYNCRARFILGMKKAANAKYWINTTTSSFRTRAENQGEDLPFITEQTSPVVIPRKDLKPMIEKELDINVDLVVKNRGTIINAYCQGPARKDLWGCLLKAANKAVSDKKPFNAKNYFEAAIAYAYTTGQPKKHVQGSKNLLKSLEAYAEFLLKQKEFESRIKVLQTAIATNEYISGQSRLKTAQLHYLMSRTYFWSLKDMQSAEKNLSIALNIFDQLDGKERYENASSHKLMAEIKIRQKNKVDAKRHAQLALEMHGKLEPREPQPSATLTSGSSNKNIDDHASALREYNSRLQVYKQEHAEYVRFHNSLK